MLLIEKCIGLIHVYWSNPVWIVLDVVVVAWILDFRFVYSCWVNLVYALLHLPFRSSIVLMALLIVIVGFLFSLSLAAVCVGIHMDWSGSMALCAAGSASVAMPRKLASSRYTLGCAIFNFILLTNLMWIYLYQSIVVPWVLITFFAVVVVSLKEQLSTTDQYCVLALGCFEDVMFEETWDFLFSSN